MFVKSQKRIFSNFEENRENRLLAIFGIFIFGDFPLFGVTRKGPFAYLCAPVVGHERITNTADTSPTLRHHIAKPMLGPRQHFVNTSPRFRRHDCEASRLLAKRWARNAGEVLGGGPQIRCILKLKAS